MTGPRPARRRGHLVRLLAVGALLAAGGHASPVLAQLPADTAAGLRHPSNFEDRFRLAKLQAWNGHFATAESLFVQLLDERPDDYDSRIGLADVRRWLGRYDAAKADLEALHRTHPNDAEVLFRLGRVHEAAGNPREARRYLKQLLEADPDHAGAREALRRLARGWHWGVGIEGYGEHISHAPATRGTTASVEARLSDRVRWGATATMQNKFDRTEVRFGGELTHRLFGVTDLHWSAYLAPGGEVLPRQTYGLGVVRKMGRRLVVYGDYSFLDFEDANVHRIDLWLELYAGPHWIFSGRHAYSSTRFSGAADAVGNHAGSVSVGYLYGGANLLQVFAGAGGEAFALPSVDVIGGFSAHTLGIRWRQLLTPWLGLALFYAHQDRSDGTRQDSYGLGLVRRW